MDANFWHRNPEVCEKNAKSDTARDKAPIAEKESFRRLQSYLKACETARSAPETHVINMTDREGDIIEIFEAAAEQEKQDVSAYFIIRSRHDRCVEEKDEETKLKKKLKQRLKETASIREVEYTIPPTENRKQKRKES